MARNDKMRELKKGVRVEVFACDEIPHKSLGYGTITKLEPLIAEETSKISSIPLPTIKLDSGKELNGLDCWYYIPS